MILTSCECQFLTAAGAIGTALGIFDSLKGKLEDSGVVKFSKLKAVKFSEQDILLDLGKFMTDFRGSLIKDYIEEKLEHIDDHYEDVLQCAIDIENEKSCEFFEGFGLETELYVNLAKQYLLYDSGKPIGLFKDVVRKFCSRSDNLLAYLSSHLVKAIIK